MIVRSERVSHKPVVASFVLPVETVGEIERELGPEWVPVTNELARIQATYQGGDVPSEEFSAVRAVMPLAQHPFFAGNECSQYLTALGATELDRLADEAERLVERTHRALDLWREYGIDADPIFRR